MIESEDQARQFAAQRVSAAALASLDAFARLLVEENRQQNLIARSTEGEIWTRHIADGIQLLDHVPRGTAGTWLDLGSGAGLPAIPIAVARPDFPVVMVESRKRRVEWLEQCIAQLRLTNCRVAGCRLERLSPFPAGIISARAFAPLPDILRLSAPFSTSDTYWVLPKGRSAAQELQELPAGQRRMFHVEQSQTSPDAGIVVGRGSQKVSKIR